MPLCHPCNACIDSVLGADILRCEERKALLAKLKMKMGLPAIYTWVK